MIGNGKLPFLPSGFPINRESNCEAVSHL